MQLSMSCLSYLRFHWYDLATICCLDIVVDRNFMQLGGDLVENCSNVQPMPHPKRAQIALTSKRVTHLSATKAQWCVMWRGDMYKIRMKNRTCKGLFITLVLCSVLLIVLGSFVV